MQKNKLFSSINILGLALGIACSLLIILWVQDEKRIDAFHTNSKYLYSIYERQYYDGKISTNHQSPSPLPSHCLPGIFPS